MQREPNVRQLPRFIGMVHLPPLPGSPGSALSLAACEARALADARALAAGGADGLIVENFGDAPFRRGRVDPHTVAAMTRIALRIRTAVDIAVGINVLRNDALAALGIAQAAGASFIRVNVLCGVMATDQGLITGEADELMRLRRFLDATDIAVFADVLVKHAAPLAPLSVADAVEDVVLRGHADAVIVSGAATGKPAELEEVQAAVRAAAHVPVFIGSGANAATIGEFVPPAYGAIAGTSLKRDGGVTEPVDEARVRAFAQALARTSR
jgi:hypothetical protein